MLRAVKPPNLKVKLYFIGAYLGFFALAIVAGVVKEVLLRHSGPESAESVHRLLAGVFGIPLFLAWFGCALWWVADAWGSIPVEHREVAILGKPSGPDAAAMLLIPLFNLIWMFLCNLGIKDSVNRACAARNVSARVSENLALAACVLQLVPCCNLLVAPFVWFAFMSSVDSAREALAQAHFGPGA